MSDHQAFLMNLPPEIIMDILSRLPPRTTVSCKCVCRKFLELISSADFAEFHLSKSSPGLIIHQTQMYRDLCKIFEFDDGLELQHHNLHYKQLMEFDPRTFITSPTADISMEGGSVNGLLCLQDVKSHLDAFYICNPITREYIALPRIKKRVRYQDKAMYGFGQSSSSGQYKLVKISQSAATSSRPFSRNIPDLKCLIYTLGEGSWGRIVPGATFELNPCPCNAFLNGSLHWLVGDAEGCPFIACFDLETEMFKPFAGHPFPRFFPIKGSMVILGGCLCFCDCSSDEEIVVWVMKEYGVKESWTKEYVIDKALGNLGGLSYEAVVPLKAFKNGDILFFWQDKSLFYYSSKTETIPDEALFEVDGSVQVLPMLHTPSFLSLQRFVKENVGSF